MSMFSIPDELVPNGKIFDEMMKETKALMPAEFAGAVNLMAHPLAGVAAMSALGLGFASHAAGVWFGALSGATAASQRMFASAFDEYVSVDEFRDTARTPEKRARAVASALIAEVGAVPAARDALPSKPVAEKASKVLRVVETPPAVEAVPEAASKPARTGGRKTAKAAAPAQDVQPVVALEQPVVKAEPIADEAVPFVEAPEVVETAPAAIEGTAIETATAPVQPEAPVAVAEVAPVVAEAVPASPRKPAAIEKPEAPDDLKAISGIGPKLEQVLNGFGVWTYAQVAGWDRQEIAWVDDTLGFKGRIDRDGWIGQAAALAGAKH
jgi:NADH-quinone oxidoreductase subunit E